VSVRTRVARLAWLAPAVLVLALYYVMAVTAASQKSVTFDEMAHLTAGYSYWAFDDYRLHPENGNWPQRWGALPLVFAGYAFPTLDQPAWTLSNMYVVGDQFFYMTGNDADRMLFRARAMMALLGVACGALVFAWARRLLSPAAAWVSLLLFCAGPTLLAHGPLVTSDMAAALFFTAAAGGVWVVLHRITPWTVLASSVLAAGVFLSKFSGPIFVAVAAAMLVVRLAARKPLAAGITRPAAERPGRLRQLALLTVVLVAHVLVVWTLVWASYGFRYTAFAAGTTSHDAFMAPLANDSGMVTALVEFGRRHRLLPEAYIYGFAHTMQFATERSAFLKGEIRTTGWWWFFPYAFTVKTTLPALLVGLLSLAALVTRWRAQLPGGTRSHAVAASLYAGTPLLSLLAVYGVSAISSPLNIGHRHLLPMYPALCILAGGAVMWIEGAFERRPVPAGNTKKERKKARKPQAAKPGWMKAAGVVTVVVLSWHVIESLRVRPHYLAYFNQLAGGPREGYRHLADSSLDWGQDLPALKRWLDEQGLQDPLSEPVYLSYFGTGRPEYYGIRAVQLPGFLDRRPRQQPEALRGGTYCISATMLNVLTRDFWTPESEADYQRVLDAVKSLDDASESAEARAALIDGMGEDYWWKTFHQFDQMRLGRLAAVLRAREPDAQIGFSILVYRLSGADVAAALYGPAPRVLPVPH
jgi:4-amino-4-deoxy-L-arabinose transferase-like glycosyltransferase